MESVINSKNAAFKSKFDYSTIKSNQPANPIEGFNVAESGDKYRTIFESIDEGYLLCKIIFDQQNKPVDVLFLEANPAFEYVTGIKIVVGKTLRQILPNVEQFWISIPALVLKMGKAIRHVGYITELERWMDVHFFRIGNESDQTVAVLVNNITERKQQEANAKFIADITTQFSNQYSTLEILRIIAKKICTYFDVSRCHFSDIDEDAGTSIVIADWHVENLNTVVNGEKLLIRDFISDQNYTRLRSGEAIIVNDVKKELGVVADRITSYSVQSYIAAPLTKEGKLKFLVNISRIEPRTWRKDEIELLRELASRVWLHLERLRAEEALRESEQRFRTLFETMDEGFAVCELIRDEAGKGIDYKILQMNPASELITGLKINETIGQLATEVIPGLDKWWITTYQSIIDSGIPKRFEHYIPQMGKWFDINAFPYGGNNFALLYDDITKRKQSEEFLLNRKERKAFIIRISDSINNLEDPVSIMNESAALLGKQLHVNRVVFAQFIDNNASVHTGFTDGVKAITGNFSISPSTSSVIMTLLNEGGILAVNDVNNDSRIAQDAKEKYDEFEVRSFISIALIRNNKIIESIGVHCSATREWTVDEISMVSEIGERVLTATERARVETALRKSKEQYLLELEAEVQQRTSELFATKEQYSSLIENTPDIITRWDRELRLLYANTAFESKTGVSIKKSLGIKITEIVKSMERSSSFINSLQKVFDSKIPVVYYNSWLLTEGERYYYSRIVPEKNEEGEVVSVLSIARDITELKKTEQELLELKLRQQREIMNTVLATQEQERERIGEALHNGVAQLLYGIQTRMELFNPQNDNDKRNITEVMNIARDAINDIRKISFELIPVVLKDFGIEVALKSLFEKIVVGKPQIDLVFSGLTKRLPEQIEFAVYRIVQELVNNILKHSKATYAKIELSLKKGLLTLKVTDNGIGVSVSSEILQGGIGLQSVKNRVHLLGGTMFFHPVEIGTSVEITLEV